MTPVRLRLFYFCALGALGGTIPILGGRLDALGVGAREIGLLMAVLPAGRIVSGPLWAWYADRTGRSRDLIVLGGAIALAGTVALSRVDSTASVALALAAFAIGRAPMGPIVDALAIETLEAHGRDRRAYGTIRAWGSVGFLAMAALAGWLRERFDVDVPWAGIVLAALTLGLSWTFPAPREPHAPAPVGPALRAMIGTPGMGAWLGFIALHALTLSVYDTFFSVHVHRLGLPDTTTGWAVAVGVIVEVAMLQAGQRLLARFGAERLMLLAALSAVPRFAITAVATTGPVLVCAQALHGTSFAWFWVGAVHWIASRAPREVAASAQSLLATGSYGVGALVGALAAGEVARVHGTGAVFLALAGVACLASACAWGVLRAGVTGARVVGPGT